MKNKLPVKTVGVIGGGIFGILSALEIAKKGYSVTIFEKETDIITGASIVNQCRIHMGYHYPRDEKTVTDSLDAKGPFEKFFGKTVVRKIDNYYMVAKEGSLTTPEDFLKFCKKMNLPYTEAWPKGFKMTKEKIALSVKVPETIFCANGKRDFLKNKISKEKNITLFIKSKVVDLKKEGDGFVVKVESKGKTKEFVCDAVVNAAYGAGNYINNLLGLPLQDFQYELCEVPVVKTPWKGTGWSVIDGPFFGVMPFGFSKNYLFYDVVLSVLERSIGKFPEFKFDVKYYNDSKRRTERFKKYIEKWSPWFKGLEKCKQVSSMYVTRVVLPKREKTDARPTVINEHIPGFWQIFSGKITHSVPNSIKLAESIDNFLKNK